MTFDIRRPIRPPPPFDGTFSNHLFPIFSTARCSSSRNSLRGITHSPTPHFGGGATSSFDGIFFDKELNVFEHFSLQGQGGMQAHRLPW